MPTLIKKYLAVVISTAMTAATITPAMAAEPVVQGPESVQDVSALANDANARF